MLIQPFRVGEHNSHYQGAYNEREMQWRRTCAIEKVNNIERLLGNRTVENVLEVGCGTGAVLAEVARRSIGSSHTGIDVASSDGHADPGIEACKLLTYDGDRLPFADASFDFVYASHVVEHVPNPRGFLREMKRVARGAVYIEVPCELHARTSWAKLQSTLDIGHINSYTPETFLMLLQSCGLNIVDLDIFDHTLEVHKFNSSPLKGWAKMAIRRTMLRLNRAMAPKIFTFHCGALALVTSALDARQAAPVRS